MSAHDNFHEHQRSIVGVKRRKYKQREEKPSKEKKLSKKQMAKLQRKKEQLEERQEQQHQQQQLQQQQQPLEDGELDWEDQMMLMKYGSVDGGDELDSSGKPHSPGTTRRYRKKALLAKTPEMMAMRRRKLWQLMAKKELGKVQRSKANNHKEQLTGCKRVATMCMKIFRQKAMQSQKNMKETVWRAKRLTREMQGYWKRYDRVERETRRRMEKEAEEQRKVCSENYVFFIFKLQFYISSMTSNWWKQNGNREN